MATIDNLSIQVTANADNAARALDRLASSAGRLRGAAKGAGDGLKDTADNAKDAATETQKVQSQTEKTRKALHSFWNALKQSGSYMGGAFLGGMKGIVGAFGSMASGLLRIAKFRIYRTIVKDLGQSFKDLYGWSRQFGTEFSKSMDRINTASLYLRNSFAAMVSPIIDLLAPAFDLIVDKLVNVFNFVNQILSALNGSDTYTVAKKFEQSWGESLDSTTQSAKKLKKTILGFDEINKLNDNTNGGSSSSPYTPGYQMMFEEKPLEGFFKKLSTITDGWPDWLKWLFGIGTVAIAAWGISQLPKLIGAIWDALKNLFSIHIPDWFKWLFGPKDDDTPGTGIPDHIDIPDADIDVNLNKGDWSVLDDIKDIEVLIKPSNTVDDIWTLLKKAWDALCIKELYVNLTLNQTANGLWKSLEASWSALGNKELFVNLTLNQTANGLWKSLEASWNALGNKELFANLTLNQTANGLWKSLESSWDALGIKELFANLTLNQTANGLWKSLEASWGALGNKELFVSLTLNQTANGLWKSLEAAWNGLSDKKLYIDVSLNQTANGLWKSLETAWNGINDKTFSVPVTLGTTAIFLWTTFKTAWDTAATTLTVKVKLEKDGWTDIDTFIGFGGASSGGGQTSGGGAGRYTVKVGLASPTNSDATTFFGRLTDAWNAAVLAANKGLNVITIPVMNAVGEKLSNIGTKLNQWLFGNTNTPSTNVTLVTNLGAGTGVASIGDDGKITVTGVNATPVTINGVPGKGLKLSGTNNYSLTNMDDTTVKVNLENGWGNSLQKWFNNYFTGTEPFVNILSNLISDDSNWLKKGLQKWFNKANGSEGKTPRVNLKSNLLKGWKGSPEEALGLNKYTAQIQAEIKIKKKELKAELSFDGGGGKLTLMEKAIGGIFSNGVWSNIPQYAGGTTNAHGSLFIAGEAGPELVGHFGGRTEVLNKSQMAAAMYSAVRSAMTGIHIDASMYGAFSGDNGGADDFVEYMQQDNEAVRQQNELLRQQNELLRQLNEKEYGVSTTAINRANAYMNRRAGVTIAPVGAQ